MLDDFINVTITKDLTGDLKKSLEEISNKQICIGIPQEDNITRESKNNERITNAELLYVHSNGIRDTSMIKSMQHDIDSGTPYSRAYEFYAQEHGSPLFRVPSRPVLAPAVENSKEKIAEQMEQAFKAVLEGENVSNELEKVGMEGQNACRDWFTNPENKWAKNSPITVKRKGSDKPLIDTGELRKAITYVIRDKESD